MISQSDRLCVASLCAAIAVLLITLWSIGGLSSAVAPDTASYFAPLQAANPWGEMRHPLYGLLASWAGASAGEPGQAVLIQAILHAAATLALYGGARAGGIGSIGALCLALAALFSQSAVYHLRLLLPEAPAITALILRLRGRTGGRKFGVRVPRVGAANRVRDNAFLSVAAELPAGNLRGPPVVVRAGAPERAGSSRCPRRLVVLSYRSAVFDPVRVSLAERGGLQCGFIRRIPDVGCGRLHAVARDRF